MEEVWSPVYHAVKAFWEARCHNAGGGRRLKHVERPGDVSESTGTTVPEIVSSVV